MSSHITPDSQTQSTGPLAKSELAKLHSRSPSAFTNDCSPQCFPFMSLPAELRNDVYGFIFGTSALDVTTAISERPVHRSSHKPYRPPRLTRCLQVSTAEAKGSHVRSLLNVNRQLRREVAPFYYGKLHAFHNTGAILAYLLDQPEWALPLIQGVRLRRPAPGESDTAWYNAIVWMTSNLHLKSLEIYGRPMNIHHMGYNCVEDLLSKTWWIALLIEISGLERLVVEGDIIHVVDTGENIEGAIRDYLAPKMMKGLE